MAEWKDEQKQLYQAADEGFGWLFLGRGWLPKTAQGRFGRVSCVARIYSYITSVRRQGRLREKRSRGNKAWPHFRCTEKLAQMKMAGGGDAGMGQAAMEGTALDVSL